VRVRFVWSRRRFDKCKLLYGSNVEDAAIGSSPSSGPEGWELSLANDEVLSGILFRLGVSLGFDEDGGGLEVFD
jgi:hypothetical protein